MLANWQSFIKSEVFYHRHCADIDFFIWLTLNFFCKRGRKKQIYIIVILISVSLVLPVVGFSHTRFPCAVLLSQKVAHVPFCPFSGKQLFNKCFSHNVGVDFVYRPCK